MEDKVVDCLSGGRIGSDQIGLGSLLGLDLIFGRSFRKAHRDYEKKYSRPEMLNRFSRRFSMPFSSACALAGLAGR